MKGRGGDSCEGTRGAEKAVVGITAKGRRGGAAGERKPAASLLDSSHTKRVAMRLLLCVRAPRPPG